ncbi:hypothetical protein FRB95_007524 [Tulasnella sp. JGI-2019a]|nr:hypothetical protein FRB95_007524 [Tulasnella sp. JGI-2019a]
MLRGLQEGFAFMAMLVSDCLFCWRLYVIWSRNIRVILHPTCLLAVTMIGFSTVVVTDFLLAVRPNDRRYLTRNMSLYIWMVAVVLTYTFYITTFIVGRLWWVGSEVNKFSTTNGKRRNGYQGAINAIAQSGMIYSVSMTLALISAAIGNVSMIMVIGCISPSLNGISATLLILELNMYQDRTKRDEDSNLPAVTGASIHFAAPQGVSSSIGAQWTESPVMRRRRASIATCQHRECCKDVADASGQLAITFLTSATPTNNRAQIRTVP